MDPETRNGAKSGETAHLLHSSTPAPVIRRGSAANRPVKNGGSRQAGGDQTVWISGQKYFFLQIKFSLGGAVCFHMYISESHSLWNFFLSKNGHANLRIILNLFSFLWPADCPGLRRIKLYPTGTTRILLLFGCFTWQRGLKKTFQNEPKMK